MPHFWNNILVVEYAELVPEWFATKQYLSVRLVRAKKRGYGIRKVRPGKGKHSVALIEYDSLSAEIKEALGDPRKTGHILEEFYTTDVSAIEYYQAYKFKDNSYIDDKIQQKYITNASVLNAVKLLKYARETERMNKGYSHKGVFKSLVADVASFNEVLKKKYGISHDLPANEIRFKGKYKEYHEKGYKSLITRYHKNNNRRKVTDKVEILLNNIFAGTDRKPTATEISRQYDTFISGYLEVFSKTTGELFEPKGYPKLSKSTITNFLASWASQTGTHAKRNQGNRQVLMQKFSTYHSLADPKFAGELLSIDDRNPPFRYAKNKRVWFYMGIDLGADVWTVWVHGTTKEGLILNFYRQLVRNYHEWGFNLPLELECESSLNSSFKHTFLQEGRMFSKVRIEANKARAKKVERKFGAFRYEYEKKLKGFIARPNPKSEPNQAGNIELGKIPYIPYDDIVENSLHIIEQWNNKLHPNQSLHPNMTRWEVFAKKQTPKSRPTNYRAILPYLGYKTESSCNAGIVKLQGQEHLLGDNGQVYVGKKLIDLMKQVEGMQLDLYWLDANDGSVIKALVYLRGGTQYICEALLKPVYSRSIVGRSEEGEKARTIMSSYSNTIDGYIKRQKNEIDRVFVIDHKPIHEPEIAFRIKKDRDNNTEFEKNIAFESEAEALALVNEQGEYRLDSTNQFDTF